jgi:hypothetical protein
MHRFEIERSFGESFSRKESFIYSEIEETELTATVMASAGDCKIKINLLSPKGLKLKTILSSQRIMKGDFVFLLKEDRVVGPLMVYETKENLVLLGDVITGNFLGYREGDSDLFLNKKSAEQHLEKIKDLGLRASSEPIKTEVSAKSNLESDLEEQEKAKKYTELFMAGIISEADARRYMNLGFEKLEKRNKKLLGI